MGLKDAARTLAHHGPTLTTARPLPEAPRLMAREQAIAVAYGMGGALPEPPDLAEIAARVTQALRDGAPLARRDLKMAPLCIWAAGSDIAHAPELLKALLARIERAGRRQVIRTLAAIYLRLYDLDRPGLGLVGGALVRLITPAFRGLYDLQAEFGAFEPETGPRRIAEACIQSDTVPHVLLARYGVTGQAVSGGFGSTVWRLGLARFAKELGRTGDVLWVQAALAWNGEPGQTGYQDANRVLAETLLLPFQDKTPPEDLQQTILDAILGRLGDPRLHPEHWVRAQGAAEVAKRWLTRMSLRQFLEVVDETAYRQQWDYRRAFWMAYQDKGWILDAWVAFGPEGERRARAAFGRNVSFGRLTASWKSVDSGHAVLIMRIGDYTVVDWSHNGRCIVWPTAHQAAPRPYLKSYHSGDLAPRIAPDGGLEQTHHGAQSYTWQHKVAAFIADKTGLRLSAQDFRVH